MKHSKAGMLAALLAVASQLPAGMVQPIESIPEPPQPRPQRKRHQGAKERARRLKQAARAGK